MIIILPPKNNALKIIPLRGKNKIDALFKNGLTAHSSALLLKFQLDDNSLFREFCVSVSKKKIPRAVDRNKIKRLFREIIRKNYNSIPSGKFLFIYNNNQIPTFASLCNETEKLLNGL